MGKHSAPSKRGQVFAKAGAVALAVTGPIALTPSIANAAEETGILEVIAKCESGNRNVNTLGGSTASGYLQILDSTWKAFGGKEFASRAINASREEQFIVGARVLQGQGIAAWNPSRSCWGGKVGSVTKVTAPAPAPKKTPLPTPAPVVKKVEPVKKGTPKPKVTLKAPTTKTTAKKAAASYLIRRGDTLSGIARSHQTTVKRLASLNRDTVKNVDLIFAGAHLRLR